MRTKPPRLPKELSSCRDFALLLAEARQEEQDLELLHIKNAVIAGADLSGLNFQGILLENCRLLECQAERTAFVDVIFRCCDLSNTNFGSSYFHRVGFSSCKGLGTNFYHSTFKQVRLAEVHFQYANFDDSKLEYMEITGSDLTGAILGNCRLNEFTLEQNRLDNVTFLHTSLKDLDLRENQFHTLVVSDSCYELRGALVSPWQAVELARLFGLVIKA